MNKFISRMLRRRTARQLSQKEIIQFMQSRQTLDGAVRGSMQKRLELIERVSSKA